MSITMGLTQLLRPMVKMWMMPLFTVQFPTLTCLKTWIVDKKAALVKPLLFLFLTLLCLRLCSLLGAILNACPTTHHVLVLSMNTKRRWCLHLNCCNTEQTPPLPAHWQNGSCLLLRRRHSRRRSLRTGIAHWPVVMIPSCTKLGINSATDYESGSEMRLVSLREAEGMDDHTNVVTTVEVDLLLMTWKASLIKIHGSLNLVDTQ